MPIYIGEVRAVAIPFTRQQLPTSVGMTWGHLLRFLSFCIVCGSYALGNWAKSPTAGDFWLRIVLTIIVMLVMFWITADPPEQRDSARKEV